MRSTGWSDLPVHYGWLIGLGALMIASGIGLRDPWPADEPRFALIAREMVATGDWLLPRVGGELYADKPPLYFWLLALALTVTGSLRAAFLLPSLVSSLLCVVLVYDLARRLWDRETAFAAGLGLLLTIQFVWQARQAQIDATLCLCITLSLYGLLRHLLLGPQWRWYAIGWAAAGAGVLTKGVGFLPLLIMIPYVLMRPPHWNPRPTIHGSRWWCIGPLSFAAVVGAWLVPLLLAASNDPALAAYRDELLWSQTIDRYAHAWHHREPFWYYTLEVIPWLWLPLTSLLPWLLPRWRDALRAGDLRIALPLSWMILVVLFFSFSPGKRGVYLLQALPAFVLACAPSLTHLRRSVGPRLTVFAVAVCAAVACALGSVYLQTHASARAELILASGLDATVPLATLAGAFALTCALAGPRRGFLAYSAVLVTALLVISFWAVPVMDETRSGRAFAARIAQFVGPARELGLVGAKDQYLLQMRRPVVHFGHARWRDWQQESADAALWLSLGPGRRLVVDARVRALCFRSARSVPLGTANRTSWYLVSGHADVHCVRQGHVRAAHSYVPDSGVRGTS